MEKSRTSWHPVQKANRYRPWTSFSGTWARNGSLVAEHDGRQVGSLEFQTATGRAGFKIGTLKVDPAYQGRGIGRLLMMAARREIPEGPVNPGWMTDQGLPVVAEQWPGHRQALPGRVVGRRLRGEGPATQA